MHWFEIFVNLLSIYKCSFPFHVHQLKCQKLINYCASLDFTIKQTRDCFHWSKTQHLFQPHLICWQNINWNTYSQHIINQDKYISDCLVPWQSSKQWQTALGKLKKKYAVPIKSIEENSLKQFSRNKVWKCFVHFSRFHTWSPFSSRIFPLSSTPMQS